ncbi:MAG: ArsR/SmtB family transcription factor [Brevinemataceae bacterium]
MDLYFTLKALADSNRLRIIAVLNEGELCACQLVELIGVSGAAISQHMNVLVQSNICISKKRGKWVYYQLKKTDFLDHVIKEYSKSTAYEDDIKTIETILSISPEELCRLQKKK